MSTSSEEDSFATPNPARRVVPGFKQPKPLSTHTNQIMNGWITTEKPTAGSTPPTTGLSKRGLRQLHLSPQKYPFKSSRKSSGGGAVKDATPTENGQGAWQLGRTGYTVQRNSPLIQRGKGKAGVVELISRPKAGDTPIGATRQPFTPPDEDELDGMFSLRVKDKGKGRATLSQMVGPGVEGNTELGEGFPETVADSQEEEQDPEEDVFSLNRPRRQKRPALQSSTQREELDLEAGIPEEMQESITFIGHRNAAASGSRFRSGPASSTSRPARTSQGPVVQTKMSKLLKPLSALAKAEKPEPKRVAKNNEESGRGPAAILADDTTVSTGKRTKRRRHTIIEDREGARRVSLSVETQDIVPDSQFDEDLWNKVPVRDAQEVAERSCRSRSDTGEDVDHPIEVFDESMVPQLKPAHPSRVEPVVETKMHQEASSDSSMRAESDDEVHSLAYREHLQLLAAKRHINRSSGTAQDDESYRPAAFVGKPMRGRRVPIGDRMSVRSGLRAMAVHHDGAEDEERSADEVESLRATNFAQSKSRTKSTEVPQQGASRLATEGLDAETEQLVSEDAPNLADAARSATEKIRLGRTISGGSSRTSATCELELSSDLTPLPSDYEEEGPDALEVQLPDELRFPAVQKKIGSVVRDEDDEITPRRPTKRVIRIESQDESGPGHAGIEDGYDGVAQRETMSSAEFYPTVDDLEMAFGSAPINADETMPATLEMDMDEDAFAQPIPAHLDGSTIPQSWSHVIEPSLFSRARELDQGAAQPVSLRNDTTTSSYCPLADPPVMPGKLEGQLQPLIEPESKSCLNKSSKRFTPSETPRLVMTPPRPSDATMLREQTPQTPPRPAIKAVQILRTPHREPLRDLGFTVPILGQPRTPIGPASTRKFIARSPQSPVTPSKLTPTRASWRSPRSVGRTPTARQEEWVDNTETLATWSPAKFESFYAPTQPVGGGTSLRQAFEDTLHKEPSSPLAAGPTGKMTSSSPRNTVSDIPVLGNEPSTDSTARSAGAEGRHSLEAEMLEKRKRKLASSEDDTIPGTFQNSGPSFHLLQSAPHPILQKKRAKLSEEGGNAQDKQGVVEDPNVTPKAINHAVPAIRHAPLLDPHNPMTIQADATSRSTDKQTTPRPFDSVANAWSGVQQDEDADPSSSVRRPSNLRGKKHDDRKAQTSLHAFGYSKQRKKKNPERALLDFDRAFEDEEDVDPDMTDVDDGDIRTDDPSNIPIEPSIVMRVDWRMSHVPLPPTDPRLRGQGRKMAQEQREKEQALASTEQPALALVPGPRPRIEPLQSEPCSNPAHEARIYSLEDLEAGEDDNEVVPSSQQGENLSPLRSLSSSVRRSVEDGSSFRTMEPPGEETQLWWRAMNDMSRD